MGKTVKEIADRCVQKMEQIINNELPAPDCPLKQAQNKWKIEQVKENVAARFRQTKVTGPLSFKVEI